MALLSLKISKRLPQSRNFSLQRREAGDRDRPLALTSRRFNNKRRLYGRPSVEVRRQALQAVRGALRFGRVALLGGRQESLDERLTIFLIDANQHQEQFPVAIKSLNSCR